LLAHRVTRCLLVSHIPVANCSRNEAHAAPRNGDTRNGQADYVAHRLERWGCQWRQSSADVGTSGEVVDLHRDPSASFTGFHPAPPQTHPISDELLPSLRVYASCSHRRLWHVLRLVHRGVRCHLLTESDATVPLENGKGCIKVCYSRRGGSRVTSHRESPDLIIERA
jgi:hypothetical protein